MTAVKRAWDDADDGDNAADAKRWRGMTAEDEARGLSSSSISSLSRSSTSSEGSMEKPSDNAIHHPEDHPPQSSSSSSSSSSSTSSSSSLSPPDEAPPRSSASLSPSNASSQADASSPHSPPLTTLPRLPKPSFDLPVAPSTDPLHARLKDFLPALEAANATLEAQDAASRSIEHVREGEAHIEMNLGLGVLEEKRSGSEDESSVESGESGDGWGEDEEDARPEEKDVLGRLMGKERASRRREKVGIEEVDGRDD
ncbi:MAG: hypothetical protein M1833_006505 [Piccolia ochrophora]|nr:MAG: hypothetical protein M1833_006505 [Piccolia ochrophora]